MSSMVDSHTVASTVDRHLGRIYRDHDADQAAWVRDRILAVFGLDGERVHEPRQVLPPESEVLLITYGDSVVETDRVDGHLRSLASLVDGLLQPVDQVAERPHVAGVLGAHVIHLREDAPRPRRHLRPGRPAPTRARRPKTVRPAGMLSRRRRPVGPRRWPPRRA